MNPISANLKAPLSKAKSERALILSDFIAYLELEKGRPFTKQETKVVAIKTSHLKVPDLRWLYGACLRYHKERNQPFSKGFWGMLKVAK